MQDYILTRFNSLKLSAILATSSVMCPASGTWSLYTLSIFLHFTQIPSEKKANALTLQKLFQRRVILDARRFEAVSNLAVAIFENKTNNTIATNTVRAADGIRTPINESRSGRN